MSDPRTKEEIKTIIVEALNLEEITADSIGDDDLLFDEGLGLDSVDALELVVSLEKSYGVKIESDDATRESFKSVETLAALHFIISQGGAAWKNIGTARSSGTKLVSLDSFFKRPGVYEVVMGTPLKTVIEDLGGGFRSPVKALQIGGPLGGVVPVEKIDTNGAIMLKPAVAIKPNLANTSQWGDVVLSYILYFYGGLKLKNVEQTSFNFF